MDKLSREIIELIDSFNQRIARYLPALEAEVHQLIAQKSQDDSKIENTLDALLSLVNHGFGENLFIQLLEYYKTVNPEGADFYWNEYDKSDED